VTDFLSARSYGATGNGKTDDTTALQNLILAGAAAGKVVFVDAGTYKVTKTVYIPARSKIVGESYSVIMSSGSFFADINNPKPVIQIGHPGEKGQIEWTDMIFSTQGEQAGVVLIEWNLASPSSMLSGMWDVHARIGDFTGSDL
jgi:glucan 1,3-beta-glucosidase